MKKLLLLAILIGMTAFHAQGKIREKRSIVRLETTMGNIRIALNDETPVHRDNFLKLVSEGFYDGTLFHRVVKDFVIQAGDPDSKQAPSGKILGEGGPGYMLAPEIDLPFQYHKRGAVAMAREDDANNPDRLSNGSQFYIVWGKKYRPRELAFAWAGLRGGLYGDFETNREMEQEYLTTGGTPGLDGGYTVFGEVIEGLDVVENIQSTVTDSHDRPQTDIVILHAVVEQKSKKAGATGKRRYSPGLY